MSIDLIAGLLKRADTGGDGQDATYEQAMSDLADIVLKDRAPALRQYEVGFQLIDREEDGDAHRAVGVKVFKVGRSWLMVPIFFLNGAVKGTELLYLKNQDVFVPLQEDWIRHVLNRETQAIGSQAGRAESARNASRPNLTRLVRPPTKYAGLAAEVGEAVEGGALPSWAAALTGDPLAAVEPLPEFLKRAGLPAVLALGAAFREVPALAEEALRHHGDALAAAIKEAALAPPPGPPAPKAARWADDLLDGPRGPVAAGTLRIRAPGRSLGWTIADDLAKEAADDGPPSGVEVADDRGDDEVSLAVSEEDAAAGLSNPAATGVYRVLVAPGDFEKCLVVVAPKTSSGQADFATVVRLSDRAFVNVAPRHVWASEELGPGAWDELLAGLPEAGRPAEAPEGPRAFDRDRDEPATLFLGPGPRRGASAPLQLVAAVGGRGSSSYRVRFLEARDDGGWGVPADEAPGRGSPVPACSWGRPSHLVVGWKGGGRIRSSEGTLLVPEGFKELSVRVPSGSEPLLPGDPDLRLAAFRKAARTLAVEATPDGYALDGVRMRPDDALIALVAGVGLREKAARDALAAADASGRGRPARFLVKAADPYLASSDRTHSPAIPQPWWTSVETLDGSVPGTEHQEEEVPVDSMRGSQDLSGYDVRVPPDQVLRTVEDAARTGRREVFDAAMISSLIKTTQSDLQVDRHLGPMFSACDAIGRVLMAYYWRKKQFAERYGEQDLDSLEDQLRNVFLELGKLILNLKQKAVHAPLDVQRGLDLDASDF